MRRAIIVTGGTVVGLVFLLGYRSVNTVHTSHVAVAVAGGAKLGTSGSGSSGSGSSGSGSSGSGSATGGSGSGSSPATSPATSPTTTRTSTAPTSFTGTDVSYNYGDIQLSVTISQGKITKISVPQESATDQRSQYINSQATPILTQEALAAQGTNIDVVSGATFTSDAFAQALASALSNAGK